MSFTESIKTCFSQYVTFSGRARRPEFWWFALFALVGSIIMTIIDIKLFGTTVTEPGAISGQTSFAPFSWVFMLAIMLPYISVAVRRLHDIGRSGWWYWIALIPLVGFILLIVWFARKGDSGPNQFGPEPAV
jgi:uncharacterized membrane protein YhaH (DUF805 family)